jgi:hypothetical protein
VDGVLRGCSFGIREAPVALLLTPGDMSGIRHPMYLERRGKWRKGGGKPRHCKSRDSGFASTNRLRGRRPPGDGVLRHTRGGPLTSQLGPPAGVLTAFLRSLRGSVPVLLRTDRERRGFTIGQVAWRIAISPDEDHRSLEDGEPVPTSRRGTGSASCTWPQTFVAPRGATT